MAALRTPHPGQRPQNDPDSETETPSSLSVTDTVEINHYFAPPAIEKFVSIMGVPDGVRAWSKRERGSALVR
jgi:hypothetical protein